MDQITIIRNIYLGFSILMVVLTAIIAKKRHRAFIGYALLATVFPIPAFILVLALGDKKEEELLRTQGKGLWFAIVIGGTILFTKLLLPLLDKLSAVLIDRWFPGLPEAPYNVIITLGIVFLGINILLAFLISMTIADLLQASLFIYLESYNQHRRDTVEERRKRKQKVKRGVFCGALGMFILRHAIKMGKIADYNAEHPDDPI